jgi:hypothetical protein
MKYLSMSGVLNPAGEDSLPRVWLSIWSGHMWKVACFFGMHRWSEWTPSDPDDPSKQIRTCTRCSRVKFNNSPTQLLGDYPIQ